MVDPKKHADHRGWVESILLLVPGYRGYLEADYRRESDRLARQHLYNRLGACKQSIDNLQQELVISGNLNDITLFERAISALVALGNRIQGDVQGYSGFFDFVKIGTEELDRIYEHDIALLTDVEALVKFTSQLTSSTEEHGVLAAKVRAQIDAIANKYAERTKILQGLTE